MAELAAAARSLGLELEGVRLGREDIPLGRSAIVFLKDARGGHFAVLRPVGTTGAMVQVIDPPHVPWITDWDRLFAAKSWTSRVLIRRDPWMVRNKIPLLMALAGCVLLTMAWTHRLRAAKLKRPAGNDA